MKKSLLLILGFIVITIASCEYKYIDPIVVELPDDPISFATQIQPIFSSNCVACHSSRSPVLTEGKAYKSLTDGNYLNTTVPESSTLYEKINGNHPGVNLSATELATILKWIEQGAENN